MPITIGSSLPERRRAGRLCAVPKSYAQATKMGVMGHSDGSRGALAAVADERVSAVTLFNGSGAISSGKPFLAVSGDQDVGAVTPASMSAELITANKAAFLYFHNPAGTGVWRGHVLLMMSPERLTEATAGFWQLILNDDPKARALYTGETCGLCGHSADFEFEQRGL